MSIPKCLGQKFVFSQVDVSAPINTIKQILNLLEKAKLCSRVLTTAGNGVPLAAEIKEKNFKVTFLDTGLCSAALNLGTIAPLPLNELITINKGALAEQVVGQMLRTIEPLYIEPALYYWRREEAGTSAEVDYLIQHGNKVIPIEVKAGATGSLKSLHIFMALKKLTQAIRINADIPSKVNVKVKDRETGAMVQYQLLSIPFYLTGQIHRLLDTVM